MEFEEVKFVTPEQDPAAARVREDGGFAPLPAHAANAPQNGHQNGQRSHGARPAVPAQQSRFDWSTAAQLNPRYKFDAFVIGSGNQFAMAAAAPSPSARPRPTTRSSSTAASAWARPT